MRTFTTLTQAPSAFMEPIHNRMPILLQPKPKQVWLDLDELPDHLWEAPAPSPSDLKKAYEVSTKVNSPRNNDPALEVPVSPHCALPHLDASAQAKPPASYSQLREHFFVAPSEPDVRLSPHPALQSLYIAVVSRGVSTLPSPRHDFFTKSATITTTKKIPNDTPPVTAARMAVSTPMPSATAPYKAAPTPDSTPT